MARARPIEGLTEELPYAAAAAKVVAVRGRELTEQATGVLDTSDIERVHDMRVATRRLRAALEVFEPCFPRKRFRATLKEIERLADVLGERRDRDVHIAAMEQVAAAMSAPDRPGIESMIDRLRAEQLEANEGLAPLVTPDRLAALTEQLDDLVEAAEEAAG